jgi:hypothetical protein
MAARTGGIAAQLSIGLAGLVLGPLLLVAGSAIAWETDAVARFVPLERAWIQGALALPMLVLSPAALSLAWSDSALESAAKWLSRGTTVAIFLGIIALFAGTLTQILCQPVTSPIETLRVGLPVGGVAALGFFGSVTAGRGFASSERPVAAVVAAVVTALVAVVAELALAVFLFPGVSCARVLAPA